MKDKEKEQREASRYDAYINAEMDDAALFLYSELRQVLLGGIVAEARRGLGRIDGYCERSQVARVVGASLKAVRKLVLVLLNKAAWLDDETEGLFGGGERKRDEKKREFESAMAKLAGTCREIADLVGEAAQ